jgi:hypothetical protein
LKDVGTIAAAILKDVDRLAQQLIASSSVPAFTAQPPLGSPAQLVSVLAVELPTEQGSSQLALGRGSQRRKAGVRDGLVGRQQGSRHQHARRDRQPSEREVCAGRGVGKTRNVLGSGHLTGDPAKQSILHDPKARLQNHAEKAIPAEHQREQFPLFMATGRDDAAVTQHHA